MEVDLAECCARLASLFEVDKALPRAMTTNYELFTTPLRSIQVSYCEGHCFALNLNSGNVHRLKQWFARYKETKYIDVLGTIHFVQLQDHMPQSKSSMQKKAPSRTKVNIGL